MELIADSANNCLVIRLKNVRPHPNADRVKLAEALKEEETLRKLNQEAANNKKLVIQVSSNTL